MRRERKKRRMGRRKGRRRRGRRGEGRGLGEHLAWTTSRQRERDRAVLPGEHMCVCPCACVFA